MSNPPRLVIIALGISLTLNLIGIGWIIGRSTAADRGLVQSLPAVGASAAETFEFSLAQDGRFSFTGPNGETIHVPLPPGEHGVAIATQTLRRALDQSTSPAAPDAPMIVADVPQDVAGGLEWIVATLPPERRARMDTNIAVLEAPLMEEAEKVFVIREEVRDELARSTFEKPRLESALARLREQLVAIQADSHQVLADVAAELSESERAALAGRMTSRLIVREADRFARLETLDRSAGPDGDRDEEVYSEAAVPEDASVQDDAPNLE